MKLFKIVAALSIVLTSSVLAAPPKAAVPADFKVSLERQACYGFCLMDPVSVASKGLVTYTGDRFATLTGTYRAKLSKSQLERLYKALERAKLGQYKNEYKAMSVTDLPSAILKVSGLKIGARAGNKTIDHYFGDKTAPESLTRLENEMDALLGTRKWVGTGIYRE